MVRKALEWELDVQVLDGTTGKALSGRIVEAWDKDYAKNKNGNDLLWVSTTDKNGKCRGKFGKDRFHDLIRGHIDKKRPDVYFIVKDAVGNVLLGTEVKTNLKADLYAYTLRVNSKVKSQFSPQKTAKYEWTILGELTQINVKQRYVVECYDKDAYNQYGDDDWLFSVTTDSKGKFENTFFDWDFRYKIGEKEKEPDPYFVVKDLKGNILFITEVFANLTRDHVFYLRIDLKSLSVKMVAVPMAKTKINWAARIKSPRIIKFPVAYNSLTKLLANPYISFVNPFHTPVRYSYSGNRFLFFPYVRLPVKNTWEFDVKIINSKTGKPLIGARVEAWDKDFSKTKSDNDLLWVDTTDRNGHCVGYCTNNDFQNLANNHKDKGKPDVYFVVRDRKGNFLLSSKVHANIKAGLRKFILKVDPTPKQVRAIQSKTAPFWNIQGDIFAVQSTGPFIVECYDKDYSKKYGPEDLLFKETVLANGHFQQIVYKRRFSYKQGEKEKEPDIFFVVKDIIGQEIFTSKIFSNLKKSKKGEAYKFLIDITKDQSGFKTVSIPIGSAGVGTIANKPPHIIIDKSSGKLFQKDLIKIVFKAFDEESDNIYTEATFSLNGGSTFQQAIEAAHPASKGTSNLTTSPLGVSHVFIWKPPALPIQDVIFRLQPFDPKAGAAATTQKFSVGTAATGINSSDVAIEYPQDNSTQAGVVEIKYKLKKDPSGPISIVVTYSTDSGLTYKTASEAFGFGSEGLDNLSSSAAGEVHSFFWNAEADISGLPANRQVYIQIETIGSTAGGLDTVGPIYIDFTYLPTMIDMFSPPANSKQGSPVPWQYVITNRDNHIAKIKAFYSVDGKTFLPASAASGGDGIDNLQTSAYGEVKTYMWDAAKDLQGTKDGVIAKLQAFDNFPGGIDYSEKFDVTVPVASIIKILSPTIGIFNGIPLAVIFEILNAAGKQKIDKVEIEFSLNNGQTYQVTTEAVNYGSGGLLNLPSSISGVKSFYAWDPAADIPSLSNGIQKNVKLRIRAHIGTEMGEAESELFTIDPDFVGIPVNNLTPATAINRATIHLIDPPNHKGIHLPVRILLKHQDNQRVNFRVKASINGGKYEPAFAAKNSDQLTNLAAPEFNADYKYIWDFKRQLEKERLVSGVARLRFTPYIGDQDGVAKDTSPFNVTIEETEKPKKVPPKTQYNSLALRIIEGDDQEIIPGLLAYENLTVELTDANGEAVRDARITFSSGVNSQVPVTFEAHPQHRTSTDYYGRAGIRVRPEKGVQGALKILAHVVGMPGVSTVFNLKSSLPTIVPALTNPQSPFEYGKSYSFYFSFDNDLDFINTDFLNDPFDPVEFKVTTHNAEASAKLIRLPGPGTYRNGFHVDVTPSYLGGTSQAPTTEFFDLKVEVLNLPGIQAYEKRFSVQTENNAQHLQSVRVLGNGFGPSDFVFQDKRLSLEVISGHDPADPAKKLPQTGYPGLTLSTPFLVKVVDEIGEEYNESTSVAGTVSAFGLCNLITVSKQILKISWRAVGGVLSKTAAKGTKSTLELNYNEKVYFTPTRFGPWSLTASIIEYIFDKHSQKMAYSIKRQTGSSSSGTIVRDPYCVAHSGFYALLSRTFFIHSPEVIGFEDIKKATTLIPGPLLKQVKAGMKSRILVKSLSPFVASSTPKKIELQNVMSDGSDVKVYGGTSLKFKQKINLAKDQHDDSILRSGEILFLQNEEKSSSGILMACLPLSKINAEVLNLKFSIKTSGLKRQRLRFGAGGLEGDTEFPYESPVGTSPSGGAQGSVTLHNGEFVIDNCDLSFPSRVVNVAVCRTYRSQVQSLLDTDDTNEAVEPLGPGWFLDAGAHLEVSHKHLRFWNGNGVYYDYMFDFSGKGQFIFITRNDVITDEQSAYEIRDRHRNYIHFNIDGTLRFYKDRFGNKYEYKYNEKAQLVKIKDCLLPDHRNFTISYYEFTTANNKNKWVGKIKEIVDFDNRKITYEYYAKGEKRKGKETGGPGFLKNVLFPKCKTVFEDGSIKANHRSYELYEYEKDNRLGWRLKAVFGENSKGKELKLFTNHYNADGRVIKQEEAESEYNITPTATGKIDYKDKNDNTSKFTFPYSPYWDYTAPEEVTDPDTYKSEMRHNNHGQLVYIKPPKGGTIDYVYDEDSQFSRTRADLLAVIETSEKGKERITTYTYSRRHHLLLTTVGPEGNLPGVDPLLHIFINNYDHQRNSSGEGHGNIVDSIGPRTLNVVYKPLANGQRQVEWVEDEPQNDYTYNSFGQITSNIDERGVKTEYFYYAAGNPTRGSVGPVGGGFLAQVKYDTEATAKRNLHLPGNDAGPQMKITNYVYNDLGFLTGTSDEKGITSVYTLNKLGDVIKEEHGIGVKGMNMTTETHIGPNGETIKTITTQPGEGTEKIEADNKYDQYGRLEKQISRINGANQQITTKIYDTGDRLKTTIDSLSGIETTQTYNKRNLVENTTVKSGPLILTTTKAYNENGTLKGVTAAPSGEKIKYEQNDFDETIKTTDEQTEISSETILNDAGIPVVQLDRGTGGGVSAAQETVYDDYFRVRRVHTLRFKKPDPSAPAGSNRRATKIPENLGIVDCPYLSSLGELLPDEGFAPNDGRTTVDMSYDIGGDLVQMKDDELGQYMSRQDGLGRQLEFDDRNGTKINTVFNDQNNSEETSYTAKPDNPLYPETPYTFKLTSQFNKAGVLESETDERNRVTSFESDDAGNITKVINAENAEVILKYDDLDNVEELETKVKVSGTHSDLDELDKLKLGISSYNKDKTIKGRTKFDKMGRIDSVKDNADNEYKYIYENNQLKKIVLPGPHGEESFSYYSSGRLKTYTDPGGQVTTYKYEKERLSSVKTGQVETAFKYDDIGNIKEIVDKNDSKHNVRYEYDSLGNLLKVIHLEDGQPKTTEYNYDGTGKLIKIIYPNNDFIEYIYDNKTGKLRETKDQNGTITSLAYFGDNIKREATHGINTIYKYDNGRLSGTEITGLGSGDISTYRYDEMDRLIEETETNNGQQTKHKYVYDSAGRVLKEEHILPSIFQPLVIRFFYDADGIVLKEERDELDTNGDIIRIVTEWERDERGLIKSYEEKNRTRIPRVVL